MELTILPGPRMDQDDVQERYAYSRCMTCGCCLEACPQYEEDNYIGPQAIAQVRLFNMHPSGEATRDKRLEGIMGDDGITNCGNAQNCIQACPMGIPLTRAIYEEIARRWFTAARLAAEVEVRDQGQRSEIQRSRSVNKLISY